LEKKKKEEEQERETISNIYIYVLEREGKYSGQFEVFGFGNLFEKNDDAL
jgi:hypothetical protein